MNNNNIKQVRIDLADACDAIEHLAESVPSMTLKQKVDIAARLRGAAKAIDIMDKAIKDEIKQSLDGKDGTVQGSIFKAIVKYISTTRLNQTRLKDERPKIYSEYSEARDEGRVSFEPR